MRFQRLRDKPHVLALGALLAVQLALAAPTIAKTLYVIPGGDGAGCSSKKPCFLPQALKLAKRGDTVVLKDATYRGKYKTGAPGVTIEAENHLKAIIDGAGSDAATLDIRHSDTVVRGIHFDGGKKGRMIFVGSPGTPTISGVIIEHCMITQSTAAGIQIGNWGKAGEIKNVTIRHNYIKDVGTFEHPGEGIYVGSSDEKPHRRPVRNIKIYGNTIEYFTQNAIDLKSNTENVDIHHNHFIRQVLKPHHKKPGNEGVLAVDGKNHLIHSNVMENLDPTFGAFYITPGRGHVAYGNIINGMKSGQPFKLKTAGDGENSVIRDNVWCEIVTKKVPTHPKLEVSDNLGLGQASMTYEVCYERSLAILEEMKSLP